MIICFGPNTFKSVLTPMVLIKYGMLLGLNCTQHAEVKKKKREKYGETNLFISVYVFRRSYDIS